MEFNYYYSQLISKNGKTFLFNIDNRIIKVEVFSYMVEHFITIYDLQGKEVSYLHDVSHGNGFIRTIGIKKE